MVYAYYNLILNRKGNDSREVIAFEQMHDLRVKDEVINFCSIRIYVHIL